MTRPVALTSILLALMLVSALWALRGMADRQRSARLASESLAECRRLARRLRALRELPTIADRGESLGSEVQTAIEASARRAAIPPNQLTRITPEPAQRLGDTPYKEKPTCVRLADVSLQQLVTLIHALGTGDARQHAKSIRIRSPRRDDASDRWTAEFVLTTLFYDPPKATR